MEPFRELIKPNSKTLWTVELDKLFNDTKALIISKVEQGIQTFDTHVSNATGANNNTANVAQQAHSLVILMEGN